MPSLCAFPEDPQEVGEDQRTGATAGLPSSAVWVGLTMLVQPFGW